MKKPDISIGIILFCLGGYLVWKSGEYTYKMEFSPGPGFLPFWLGIVLIVLAGLLVVTNIFKILPKETKQKASPPMLKALLLLCGLGISNLLVEYLGFILVMSLMALSLMMVLDWRRWRMNTLVVISTAIVLHFVFRKLLEVTLPVGIFKF